jgi:NitT/TauT family transport system permease protein
VPRRLANTAATDWLYRILTLAALVLVWEAATSTRLIRPTLISTPGAVATWLLDWVRSGQAVEALGVTISVAVAGYIIGLVLGALVASVFAFVPIIGLLFEPYVSLFNSVPWVIVASLFVLLFGPGALSGACLAALLVFFLAFFNLYSGLRSVDPLLKDNARVLGASRLHMALLVYTPAIFSWTMTSLRTGIGFALLGAVVAEFVGGNVGVGSVISSGQETTRVDIIIGGILALAVIAVIVDGLLSRIERRYTAWRVF